MMKIIAKNTCIRSHNKTSTNFKRRLTALLTERNITTTKNTKNDFNSILLHCQFIDQVNTNKELIQDRYSFIQEIKLE